MAEQRVREAVGVFHDEKSLQSAVDELLIADFDRSYLSLLAGNAAVEEKLGHVYEKVAELEDDSRAAYQALAYVGAIGAVGAIVASGGTIAAAILGAVAAGGTGGVIGGYLARFLDQHHATYLQDQLDRGGLLLWVRVPDPEHEQRALDTLKRWSADDVHVHDLPKPEFDYESGLSYDVSFMKKLGL
jgi:hypothetical protein